MEQFNLSWIVATIGNKNELQMIFNSALVLNKDFNVKIELIFCLPPHKNFLKKDLLKRQNKNNKIKFKIMNMYCSLMMI